MATTSVCEVSVDRFEELAQKDPAVQYEIFKIMSAEIRHSQELLLLLGKHNAEKRLAAFCSACATICHAQLFRH